MNTDFIDCPEVAGKTIQLLRIHRDTGDGSRVQIELTDGTSFTCYVMVRPAVEASLYRGGAGAPEPSATTNSRPILPHKTRSLFPNGITVSLEFIGRGPETDLTLP